MTKFLNTFLIDKLEQVPRHVQMSGADRPKQDLISIYLNQGKYRKLKLMLA
jgi:16S rRNA U516 pseudouridylate synthase RsuA-like enzyme